MNFSTITRLHSDRHTMNSLVSSFLMIRLICLICLISLISLIQFTLGGCREARDGAVGRAARGQPRGHHQLELPGSHIIDIISLLFGERRHELRRA